jgi:hypothetical protein
MSVYADCGIKNWSLKMRKLYKSDKKPAQIIVTKKMSKKQIKEFRELVQNTPLPVIVPIDPEEWPDESQPPVKDADDGG